MAKIHIRQDWPQTVRDTADDCTPVQVVCRLGPGARSAPLMVDRGGLQAWSTNGVPLPPVQR